MAAPLTTEIFIKRSKERYGENEFDYSLAIYTGNKKNITLTHTKCGTTYETRPNNHLDHGGKGVGCPTCNTQSPMTYEKFLMYCNKRLGDRYDYSLIRPEDITDRNSIVRVICKKHKEFSVMVKYHIIGHSGCPECGRRATDKDDFVRRCIEVHGDVYDYTNINYINTYTRVEIYCKKHKKPFFQFPINHLYQEKGCPLCAKEQTCSLNEVCFYHILKEMYPKFTITCTNYIDELRNMSVSGADLEIDVIVKYKRKILYIEWNGVYWHSKGRPGNTYENDKIKKDVLQEKLIVIKDRGGCNEKFVRKVIDTKIRPILDTWK